MQAAGHWGRKCIEAAIAVVEGAKGMKVHSIHEVKDAQFICGTIDVLDLDIVDLDKRLYRKDKRQLAETIAVRKWRQYTKKVRECAEKLLFSM